MTTTRIAASANAKPRSKPTAPASASTKRNPTRPLLPEVSRGRLARMIGLAFGICAVVAVMTVAAGWHASGMVRRGEIEKMVRMSANMQPPAPESKNRGRLDKGRLGALASAAAR